MRRKLRGRYTVASLSTVATALLLLFLAGVAHGQGRSEGSIVGTVTDATTKAGVPGVTVRVANAATGFTRETVTSSTGAYRLSLLPPATYEVTAELAGFTTVTFTVTVAVGTERTVDISLGAGAEAEAVAAGTEGETVERAQTEESTSFSEKEVANLPTLTRDVQGFGLLSTGIARPRGDASSAFGSASGSRGDQNAVIVDGFSDKSADHGNLISTFSQEAVQETAVISQGAPAEFGGTAGGVMNMITKGGTNTFQGYGYYFLRDDSFDKPPFTVVTQSDGTRLAQAVSSKTPFRRQIGGGVYGGPLQSDRMFFFAAYERKQENTPRVKTLQQATIDVVKARAIPNLPDNPSNAVTQAQPRAYNGLVKINYTMSPNSNAVATYSQMRTDTGPNVTATGLTSLLGAARTIQKRRALALWSNAIFGGGSKLNTVRLGYSAAYKPQDWPWIGGYGNIASFPPRIEIGGVTGGNFGRSQGGCTGCFVGETKFEVDDVFSVMRGKHNFKLGGQYLYVPFHQVNDYATDAVWRFGDLASFIAGTPSVLVQSWGPPGAALWVHYYSAFAQDEWRPTANITINYGVRYQLESYPSDITSYTLPEPVFDSRTGQWTTSATDTFMQGFKNDTKNFMPRLGLTYSPGSSGKTVFRASAGSYYGNQYVGDIENAMGWDPGMQTQWTLTGAAAAAAWAGVSDPASPYYNPTGIKRLPASYYNVLKGTPPTVRSYNTEMKVPSSVQVNLGVERQITRAMTVSATYMWSRGWHNVRAENVNAREGVLYTQGSVMPSGVTAPFDLYYRGAGPRPDPGFLEITRYTNAGKVTFNGLSLGVSGRWTSVQAKLSFIWNGAWDDSTSILTSYVPSNPACLSCEYSESETNTRRVAGSVVWSSPASWPAALRDFQVGCSGEYESGHPKFVQSGFDYNLDSFLTDRPLGVPRNALITDPFRTVSIRVSRTFRLTGRTKVQIMFEGFNVFNWANYTNWDVNLFSSAGGGRYVPRADLAAYAASPELNVYERTRRASEVGLDPAIRRTSVGDPFQGQLGLRFYF